MIIKKFQGKTKDEAIALAKTEMGEAVVIMNIKEVRQKGLIGIFKSNIYEVTAALEDDVMPPKSFSVNDNAGNSAASEPVKNNTKKSNFDAVADEDITIPPISQNEFSYRADNKVAVNNDVSAFSNVNESDLKDAFAAVNQVMNNSESKIIKNDSLSQAVDVQKKHMPKDNAKPQESFNRLANMDFVENIDEISDVSLLKEAPVGNYNEYKAFDKGANIDERQESQAFFKMLYKVLLDNEVDEIYINQLIDDMEKISHSTDGLQYLISNAYQKMILKMGQPKVVEISKRKPKVVFFIGPTGVGKTTTIAKIASKFKIEEDKNVALLTADTYRIAATDQLKNYADILEIPMSIVYSPDDIEKEIEKYSNFDVVFVDTAGFSHKNEEQRSDMAKLIDKLPDNYDKEVYLVLSATTKYKDLKAIVDTYKTFGEYDLIFTKLDETSAYGNIYNIRQYTGADVSYITTGQNVPNDIDVLNTQWLVKTLLGGQ
ncbi:MAG: flagellar biosynthesis protein FlhF [Lachnospiraceae bacterium]|nr:flagellar biosynthesis protein FlhF [Lachnospiraceae bacterium]